MRKIPILSQTLGELTQTRKMVVKAGRARLSGSDRHEAAEIQVFKPCHLGAERFHRALIRRFYLERQAWPSVARIEIDLNQHAQRSRAQLARKPVQTPSQLGIGQRLDAVHSFDCFASLIALQRPNQMPICVWKDCVVLDQSLHPVVGEVTLTVLPGLLQGRWIRGLRDSHEAHQLRIPAGPPRGGSDLVLNQG